MTRQPVRPWFRGSRSKPARRNQGDVRLDDGARPRIRSCLRMALPEVPGGLAAVKHEPRTRVRLLAAQQDQHRTVAALLGPGRSEGQDLVVAPQQLVGQQLEYRPAHG